MKFKAICAMLLCAITLLASNMFQEPEPIMFDEPEHLLVKETELTPTPIPTEIPIITETPAVAAVPMYSPIYDGIDVTTMTKDEITELHKSVTNYYGNTRTDYIMGAYYGLPYAIRDVISITHVIYVDDEDFSYGLTRAEGNEYTLFINDYTEDAIFDTYAAIGELIDEICGDYTKSDEWLSIYEAETGDAFYPASDAETAFEYQFAAYARGNYIRCWNSVNTPIMYTKIDNIYNNFEDFYLNGLEIKMQQDMRDYAYQSYVQYNKGYWKEYEGNDEARMEHAITLLPDFIEEFIQKEQLVWELRDELNFMGGNYAGLIFFHTPINGPDQTTVRILKDYVGMESTVAHEVGHYVDWYLEHYIGYDITEDFKKIMEKEYDLATLDVHGAFNEEELDEYFSDTFAHCTSEFEPIRSYYEEYCPETYNFIWDKIHEIEEKYGGEEYVEFIY